MANTIGGITRTIALWGMIILGVTADCILYWQQQWVWAIFWSIVIILVIGFEIYGKFISKEKKTISNMWKKWAIEAPFIAYLTLLLLCLALNLLILHLAVW